MLTPDAQNMTGFFVLPGRTDVPFTYKVRKIRNGGIYCLRSVEVYQLSPDESSNSRAGVTKEQVIMEGRQLERMDVTPSFTATVSFKRREDPAKNVHFRYQTPSISTDHLQKTYSSVLDGKKPEDQPIAPSADATWWTQRMDADVRTEGGDSFPGVKVRKVNMDSYNRTPRTPDRAGEWRQLSFYGLIRDDKEEFDSHDETSTLNLHACAHLYASDRNSLFLIPHALGFEDQVVAMSSLSHTVIFHGDQAQLHMFDRQGKPIWFLQEAWTENGGLNRACHESRLWRCNEDGKDEIIATTKQDGMIRVPADSTTLDQILGNERTRKDKSSEAKL